MHQLFETLTISLSHQEEEVSTDKLTRSRLGSEVRAIAELSSSLHQEVWGSRSRALLQHSLAFKWHCTLEVPVIKQHLLAEKMHSQQGSGLHLLILMTENELVTYYWCYHCSTNVAKR